MIEQVKQQWQLMKEIEENQQLNRSKKVDNWLSIDW